MNLKNISDEDLRTEISQLVSKEREVLTSILHHLKEVERRRLFAKWKFTSLFDYAVKELKYSEAQAQRRISAMRLIREMPELEVKVAKGELSLTNMALAQTLFSKERKAGRAFEPARKLQVLAQLENKSSRAAQEIVFEIAPSMRHRPTLSFDSIEDLQLRDKLLRLKGLMAHTDSGLDLNQLLHRLCDQVLESHKLVKSTKASRTDSSKRPLTAVSKLGNSSSREPSISETSRSPSAPKVAQAAESKTHSKAEVQRISQAELRRQVYKRDGGKCRNCSSTFALEIDHIHPQAIGGTSTIENMRLLCRSCNQRAAIDVFGQRKMSRYLKSPTAAYG